MSRSFTRKELARYNGEEGNPAYAAVDGKVYDVSRSRLWPAGTHMGRHAAGGDLTAELNGAPHGREVLANSDIEQVGTLAADLDEHLPGAVRSLLQRFPMARRHLHPMTVHFPTAYFIAAALFIVLDGIRPSWLNLDFQVLAAAMLALGMLFTPVAIVTGLFTWWVSYSLKLLPLVVRKLVFTGTLVLAELACLAIKVGGFAQHPGVKWVYSGLLLWLGVNVMLLGYYGGQLVFPTKKSWARSHETGSAG